jgi:hypothetical protein
MAGLDPDPTVAHLTAPISQGGHGCDFIPSQLTVEDFHAKHHGVNQPVLDHHHRPPQPDADLDHHALDPAGAVLDRPKRDPARPDPAATI